MRKSISIITALLSLSILSSCNDQPAVATQQALTDQGQSVSANRKAMNTTSEVSHIPESKYREENKTQNEMQTVYDMTENSFSIAMPAGWQNIALMHRLHNSPRTLVRAISPDNNAVVFMGDPVLPVYSMPNPQMEAMYRNMGMNPPTQSSQFIDADTYFASYMQERFSRLPGFVLDEKYIDEKIIDFQRKEMQKLNFHPTVTNISYRFHYESNGRTIRGVVNGTTMSFGSGWLPEVSGYCTTGDISELEEIFWTMGKSRVQNPAWQQAQNARHQQVMAQIEANTQAMTAQHQRNMANIQASAQAHQQKMAALHQAADIRNQAWADQQASLDAQHKQFINSIRNEHTVADPSGNTYQVDNYSDKYFVDRTNNTYIGTHGTVTLDDLRQIKGLNIDNFAETIIIR